ncbi:hypothetical protein PQG02_08615 [Nostoc sp. UHCC 0926]|uniref:hypothetical protein n=1 Tax=unclassified Nostoc TaxID=2593658 RepID=UPI00235EE7DF|nr:hypothetical protein [Nostoc sp. UHCC 0926]WDD34375.1 hypothetical protein PQG02_08615 [Nostoc sp. UHCC 0926]
MIRKLLSFFFWRSSLRDAARSRSVPLAQRLQELERRQLLETLRVGGSLWQRWRFDNFYNSYSAKLPIKEPYPQPLRAGS